MRFARFLYHESGDTEGFPRQIVEWPASSSVLTADQAAARVSPVPTFLMNSVTVVDRRSETAASLADTSWTLTAARVVSPTAPDTLSTPLAATEEPPAARVMFPDISRAAASCSNTADAIELASVVTSRIMAAMALIESAASVEAAWMPDT